MADDELKKVKAIVRAVLLSCKEGVESSRFLADYREVTAGEYLPYKKFGFSNVNDFVASIPDVVFVRRQPGREDMYHAVADETTAHIQKLVSKQRSKKTKRPLRKAPGRKYFPPSANRPAGRGGYPPPYRPQSSFPQPRGPPVQPHYAAIRRYGPPPRYPPPLRGPLLPTPGSPEYWSSSSPPSSPLGSGEPFQNLQITVRNSATKRTIGAGESGDKDLRPRAGRMIMRAMSEAISDCLDDRKMTVKFGHKFEVPPRFRRHGMFPDQESTPNAAVTNANFVGDGTDYIRQLKDYMWRKNLLPLKFDTTQAKRGFYVSSVKVDTKVFGSRDMFATHQEAEYIAAKNAITQLNIEESGFGSGSLRSSVSEADIRTWLQEVLEPLPNGMWGTRLPVIFKEKFNEEAPSHFLNKIRSWTDLVEVESAFGRDLVKLVRTKPTVKWKDIVIPEPDLLDPGDSVTVYVTFALRVDNFFVQKEDSCIDDINAKLEGECPGLPAPDNGVLKKGTCCAALYHEDQSWYRAEVLDLTDENKSAQVTFVDYGNVDVVPVSSIRQLPDDIASLPAQAIPCALYGVIVTDTEDTDEPSPSLREFSEVVKDSRVTALTVSYNTDGQCEVMLSKDVLSVNMHLLKQGLARTEVEDWLSQVEDTDEEDAINEGPDTVILPDEKFLDLYVCFISPDLGVTVRIVGEDYSDKLDDFEAQLEEYFKSASPDSTITAGQVCIASMDGLYQRVLINAVHDNKAECYFTDHGDTETLPIVQLRPLQTDLNASLPYQAVRCYLHGLEKVTDTVTALESLLELALGKTCVAEIVERDERLSVILYDTNEDADFNINSAVINAIKAKNGLINDASTSRKSSKSPSKSNSTSPNSKSDVSKTVNNIPTTDTNRLPNADRSLNRTCSTVSNESWGTEEEAEALAASYLESNSGSNWESSDINSPDNVQKNTDDSISQRLEGISINSQTTKQDVSPGVKSSRTPQSVSPHGSDSGAVGGGETKKGLYTWGSPKEAEKTTSSEPALPQLVDIPGVGEFFDVHVLWVSDPTNFWCTPYKMVLLLENMMKELNMHFSTHPERVLLQKQDLSLGSLYAGRVDGAWYRVITKSWVETQLRVYFPDYGQYNIMEVKDLQPLPPKFFALPLCAIKAKLHGIGNIKLDKPWSEAAKFKFMQLTQGHDLVCLVCDKNKSSGMISVKLVDTSSEQDILIDEVLVDMNYARSLES